MATKIQIGWTSSILSHQDKLGKGSSIVHKQDVIKGKHGKNKRINPQANDILKPGISFASDCLQTSHFFITS